ncbi:MAG: SufS family cysteine desulfurase [Spirochaetales bacterium]|nr:MAG: SufS family cysteine desulfurase [Spirochaetales bacterium]
MSANIHRGVYELSERATLLYDASREKVKKFINVGSDGEVVFTKGSTEASNILAFSWGRKHLRPGDEILISEIEHHANFVPWQEVVKQTGAVLRFVTLGDGGAITAEGVADAMTNRTRIVSLTGMSNVTGYMPSIAEIAKIVHQGGAVLSVDGAQLVSHHHVDVQALDCDFLTFSGHKMCGPTGVGVLYGRAELLESMDPFIYGGDMIVRVRKDGATYKGIPDKFESGTPNISGVLALGAAVDYLSSVGMGAIAAHEAELLDYALSVLAEIPEVDVYGPAGGQQCGGIVSFNVGDIHPHDVGTVLDTEGVAVRAGFHCAQPFMQYLGVPGTVRASFYLYNTRGDIDTMAEGLRKTIGVFA